MTVDITDYIQQDSINLNLQSRNKGDAIRELAQVMEITPAMSNFKSFLKDVFEREKLETTGIGDEIAIPHARTNAVKQLIIAVGRSRHGINFESPDGRKVKLLLLMGIPQESVSHYLKILAQLTRLLKRGPLREKLLEAQDNTSVLELFKQMPQGE
jgi:fructose-specific phosphotransferase system IIA component